MKNICRVTAKSLATAIAAVVWGSAVAQVSGGAVPLAPTFSEYVQNTSGPPVTGTGPYEVSNGFASASTGYSPGEGMASLTINSGSGESQQAGATETWSFIVYGPADLAQTPVPVVLSGTATLLIQKQANSQDTDFASATFFSPIFGTYSQGISFTQETFHVASPALVTINTLYDVTEMISGYSILGGSTTRTDAINAAIDPAVQFADGFNAGAYTLGFSPQPPVPLPASAWLLLGALGGLGAFTRKPRASTTVAIL